MIIRQDVIEQIFVHAEAEAPIESCGYLMGADVHITRHYPMANAEGREDHYTFDPREQFEAFKFARREGLRIIGAYHSHPATPARPSAEDIRLAYDQAILYIIASLMDGKRAIKGFYIRDGKAEEEPLVVEDLTNT
jgi:[CysO sulfur-carrier protein]-S-L-cysteine hydrolase